jgi:hypothetical protein
VDTFTGKTFRVDSVYGIQEFISPEEFNSCLTNVNERLKERCNNLIENAPNDSVLYFAKLRDFEIPSVKIELYKSAVARTEIFEKYLKLPVQHKERFIDDLITATKDNFFSEFIDKCKSKVQN